MNEQFKLAPPLAEFVRRLSLVAALTALTPVLLLIIELPSRVVSVELLGAPLMVRLDVNVLLMLFLPTVVVTGADWSLRSHPEVQQGQVPFLFPFWIAPGMAAFALALILARLDTWAVWLAALLTGVVAIVALIAAEYVTVSPTQPSYPLARLLVSGVNYVIALGAFTLIYATRERTLVTATGMLAVAFLLAVDLLGSYGGGAKWTVLHAAITALLVGQATWAMNYWNLSAWGAGVLLLAIFYTATNLASLSVRDGLTLGALLEYGFVAAVAVIAALILRDLR
ncbi:MAG: hypothetical protein NZ693_06545 [Thermoflexales bacterium]|nr:hypothetical protein [Thermoflexales bacterium]